MKNQCLYSVLRYQHSISLGESLNAGILFYFPSLREFHFTPGDTKRIKAVYPDVDTTLLRYIFQSITERTIKSDDLLRGDIDFNNFNEYVRTNILRADASGLVFEPADIISLKDLTHEGVVNFYQRLLLPTFDKVNREKRNEQYLLKRFSQYFKSASNLEYKLEKDITLTTEHFDIKFDLAWQNSVTHYIKPVSFDLLDLSSLQAKAASLNTYLWELKESRYNTQQFDLLISRPSDPLLFKHYDRALNLIDSVNISKEIVVEDQLKKYTDKVIDELEKH